MTLRFEEYAPSMHDERYDARDDGNDQDPHVATAAAQAFARLRALVNAGYKPQYDRSDSSILLLSHPDKRFKYRDMLLDSSGAVWWRYDQDYTMHFSRWEKKRFDGFLRHVPEPSWWHRTRVYRANIGAFVVGASICAGLYFMIGGAMPYAYRYLGWS
ncbi:MAG: hypothetical protein K2Y71_07365 [Xanthobacteraceae bacterium]|nr:hypothetical protein [Xanthobacteraceae bacterium]